MKTTKKNVYYCDYCKKKGLSASAISRHEKHCTANPNRECKLCKTGREISPFIEALKARFEIKEREIKEDDFNYNTLEVVWLGEKITMNEILEFTEGCPICTLAILRQTKLNYSIFGFHYNYKKELDSWWADINQREYEYDLKSCTY